MHSHSIGTFQHRHDFLGARHARNERRTLIVVALTTAMMIGEIVAGALYGSMALLADGWHMATHASALAITALAYRFARTHAHDSRFSFGTGKLGELAGFASAVILAIVALAIAYESVSRLLAPVPIRFGEALPVAVLGLLVNLASAALLFDGGDHHHHHGHDDAHGDAQGHAHHHGHHHGHHGGDAEDNNLRSAYLHVVADAATSVLAIIGLTAGWLYGWTWLDPALGVLGALLIARWAVGLMRTAGGVLLDMIPSRGFAEHVRAHLEIDGDRVADLHLWRLGPGHVGLIASVVSDRPQPPGAYKERLAGFEGLSHVTIEVHACEGHAPGRRAA